MLYKVITIWQPWASLLACAIKKNETRPQPTSWRGIYLIHAAQRVDRSQKILCSHSPFPELLSQMGYESINEMPTECIVGSFEVDYITRICSNNKIHAIKGDSVLEPDLFLSNLEISLGNYSNGRYIWHGKNHRQLVNPLPYKGNQGYYQNFIGDESLLIFK